MQRDKMDKILAFDIWGEYAHFRKYYTTTSPLSYSIPTRTSIVGLLGAIIGENKETNPDKFSKNKASITVKLINPVKKVRISENLVNTKNAWNIVTGNRTQIKFEFVKDPCYRIFIRHNDNSINDKIINMIKEHKSVYTPYLGITEHIANFSYVGVYSGELTRKEDFVRIDSAIPKKNIVEIDFENGHEYLLEDMPVEMNNDRVVSEYSSILFERNGKWINAKVNEFYKLDNGENIVFI